MGKGRQVNRLAKSGKKQKTGTNKISKDFTFLTA